MTSEQAYELFEQTGAIQKGHFLLSSGLHSDVYLEKFRLIERPVLADRLCDELAAHFATAVIDVVLGPTTAGIILAYAVALKLGAQARYAELEGSERRLRRGQELAPGTRVLIVDDIMTTGGAVRECVEVVRRHNAVLVGVGVLGDRSGGSTDMGVRLEAVLTIKASAWSANDCPHCAAGAPFTSPGTRHIG